MALNKKPGNIYNMVPANGTVEGEGIGHSVEGFGIILKGFCIKEGD